MANRRMFSLDVVDTDNFLDMPTSTQALYFHLGMRADDEGFVASPRKITKIVGCNDDDLKLLITKRFVTPFESGVIVITDWNVNNKIRSDRKHETRFLNEKSMLGLNKDVYVIKGVQPNVNQMATICHTEDRLGKDSIDKVSINNTCPEPKKTPDPSGILLPLNNGTMYDVPLSKIEEWKVAFPAVDVEQELRKMIAWLNSNPERKKTSRGVNRFINNWLSKEQDKGGSFRTGSSQPKPVQTKFNNFNQREYEKGTFDKLFENQ